MGLGRLQCPRSKVQGKAQVNHSSDAEVIVEGIALVKVTGGAVVEVGTVVVAVAIVVAGVLVVGAVVTDTSQSGLWKQAE